MGNQVTVFLRSIASIQGNTVFNEVFGDIILSNKKPIKQSSGAVYGIFVESKNVIGKTKEIPGNKNWYPVYWGKDLTPPFRIRAHIQNYMGTGNAKLKERKEIKGKELIFGAIFVSKYKEFEKYLHENYKPLLGKNSAGNRAKIIEVIN